MRNECPCGGEGLQAQGRHALTLCQPSRESCSLTPHLWGWGSSSPFLQLLGLIAVGLVPAWQSLCSLSCTEQSLMARDRGQELSLDAEGVLGCPQSTGVCAAARWPPAVMLAVGKGKTRSIPWDRGGSCSVSISGAVCPAEMWGGSRGRSGEGAGCHLKMIKTPPRCGCGSTSKLGLHPQH